MTPGAKLIALYQTRGCEQQALELARSMGGEHWRLLWAFHRASDIIDEIGDLRDDIESRWWINGLERYPNRASPETLTALCCFLSEGIIYWDCERALLLRQQLERI